MPIYEYCCHSCGTQFQSLIMNKEDENQLACPSCNAVRLKKLISRVVYHASEQDRLDAYDPAVAKSDAFYRDSRNIGLHAKKRAKQMGVNLGAAFEEKLEKVRIDPGSVMKDSEKIV